MWTSSVRRSREALPGDVGSTATVADVNARGRRVRSRLAGSFAGATSVAVVAGAVDACRAGTTVRDVTALGVSVDGVGLGHEEIHGDDVVDLLNGVNLKPAKIDYLEERTWPRL